jgi:hypothetical protein
MKLTKLHCSSTDPLHPTTVTNVLRDKGRPYRNRLEWSTARSCFEAYTARVFVPEDAEGVEVAGIRDLTA